MPRPVFYYCILKTGTVTSSAFNLNHPTYKHTYNNDVLFDKKSKMLLQV